MENAKEFKSQYFEDYCIASSISLRVHVVLHAATLLRFCPTLLNDHSPFELTSFQVPNVAHLRTFGYRVWVLVAKPHKKTIGRYC